jgi:peptide/nickel transport system ATP-binding protein
MTLTDPAARAVADPPLVEIRGLRTHFFADEGVVRAVDGVDLTIRRGRTLCVVGESGCGKSVTARSVLQLVDPPGRIVDGEVLLHRGAARGSAGGDHDGDGAGGDRAPLDLAALDPRGPGIRDVRGRDVAMIFQEPMTSLSPVHTVGDQITEAIGVHLDLTGDEARARAVDLLDQVGIPNPSGTVDRYPFQLSGGMRQRAMIAMALSCEPSVLIADEPTTALDVTTQAQIMDLLRGLSRDLGMAVLFITHDMGVVAEMADEVAVMYLGTVVEQGPVDDVFHDPRHPYTRALLTSVPRLGSGRGGLDPIRGMVPDPSRRPSGCVFHTRCDSFMPGLCDVTPPPPVDVGPGRPVRCLLYGGAPAEGGDDGR